MVEVDLAEEKSTGIVVDESGCLRAVRSDGAALLFLILNPLRAGSTSVAGGSVCPQTTYSTSLTFPTRRWTSRAIR
jgi:hypothetical protein